MSDLKKLLCITQGWAGEGFGKWEEGKQNQLSFFKAGGEWWLCCIRLHKD